MRVGILGHLLNLRPGYRQAGVSRYIQYLVDALPAVAPADEFIVYAGSGSIGRPPNGVAARSWSLSRWPTERPPVRILWEQAIAPVALARDGIDVVHAPVNVAPLLAGRPTVVTVHDLAFLVYPEQYPGAKQRYLNLLTGASVRHADRIIAVSESTRRDLVRFYRIEPDRVTVVPNGVDAAFAPVTDRKVLAHFRAAEGLPDEFILFVGTLQPRKNLIGLLRAWAVLDEDARLPLVVVGAKGWQYEPVFDEARALGVADEIIFKGYVGAEFLPLWYATATVFVYPSLYEGFGLPVLEAMACGAAVVTSSTSALPEVAGDAAILFDPEDPGALGAAIARVVRDSGLRADLRARGVERAEQFSWERTARETLAVYREVAAPVGSR